GAACSGQHRPQIYPRRHRNDRRDRRGDKFHFRRYRRAPPSHRNGVPAGRYLVQRGRRRLPRDPRRDKQQVRRGAPGKAEQEPRPQKVRAVNARKSNKSLKRKKSVAAACACRARREGIYMINIPKGTKDVLPQDAYKWHYLEDTAREVARLYNI